MDAVTYPNEKLIDFINDNVIPLQILSDHQLATDFKVKWTPSLLVLDSDGEEHHRTVGFLSAEELIPSILLGIGNTQFDNDEFDGAIAAYDNILEEYAQSDSAAEAMFQRGVAGYKGSGDPKPLKLAYEGLIDKYPDSEWANRAQPYRLIP